ncbi:hypothetical protein K3495_g11725 [Podosphaera aphanis]|nr:hypothetical protein K3495_g11725 [Podosphaera aphanis]
MANQEVIEQLDITYKSSLEAALTNTNIKNETVSVRDTLAHDQQDGKYRIHLIGQGSSSNHKMTMNYAQYRYEKLFSQVSEWLQAEKRRAKRVTNPNEFETRENTDQSNTPISSTHSGSNSSMLSLERLQQILTDSMMSSSSQNPNNESIHALRRPSVLKAKRYTSARKQQVTLSSSDTEYQDGSAVPSCDIFLDNKKTSYSYDATKLSSEASSKINKEEEAWRKFKADILSLAHTLRLKGWRRVPVELLGDLEVERLSGALTNAVYVISPPKEILLSKKYPKKVLLRIYGPQVEHLINRHNELSILRRLARKKIGPRMLGIFSNGRFEEYFNANTLTADDLRVPETSNQIAKRMRELHDGIELLVQEREEGPSIWKNWDRWVKRCEEIALFLDAYNKKSDSESERLWKFGGYICGDEWPKFKLAVDRYRKWLDEYYGKDGIKRKLVFAHNDTQYGNILRLLPNPITETSLIPLPGANMHKQLIVIDFEYASANPPGLEFANHFTEWCYNYHNPSTPWLCETGKYPSLEEQTRFIRSYINHHSKTDTLASSINETSSIEGDSGETDLDRGNDVTNDFVRLEDQQETETEPQVQEILKDTFLWRAANSAQWVAWGIIQARIPELALVNVKNVGMQEIDTFSMNSDVSGATESTDKGFDYLSYASDRALFFWGDMLKLGIVMKEDLPIQLLEQLKTVDT